MMIGSQIITKTKIRQLVATSSKAKIIQGKYQKLSRYICGIIYVSLYTPFYSIAPTLYKLTESCLSNIYLFYN